MLKKILGEAPFDVTLEAEVVLSPDKCACGTLVFQNSTEYDLPLSCSLKILTSVKADRCEFDVIVPAEGNTRHDISFSVSKDAKILGGKSVCELEIIDGVLDSKTVYELETVCEMSYKCCVGAGDIFDTSDDVVFSRDGVFFANSDEVIAMEIPRLEKTEMELCILSGSIKNYQNGQIIELSEGLSRLYFEVEEDGSFEFLSSGSGEKIFLETLSPKYFI